MGLGLGRLLRETKDAPLALLLSDATYGETEVVFRDFKGRAILVVDDSGNVSISKNLRDNRTEYFGVLDA